MTGTWGRWYPEFDGPLRQAVAGRHVWALGSGIFGEEYELLHEAGAVDVVEVDKLFNTMAPRSLIQEPGRWQFPGLWSDFLKKSEHFPAGVAFLKWPSNAPVWPGEVGVHVLLSLVPEFIYVGLNRGGSACGTKQLLQLMLTRELLHEVQQPKNDFLHYGLPCKTRRPEAREEKEMFDMYYGDHK